MDIHFPGLRDEGITFSCDRAIALANEDREFLSWEHPLITAAMEMVPASETGNTAMTAVKYKGVRAGTLLLECLFTLDTACSEVLQTSRYLPSTTIRVVADQYGKDHSDTLTHESIMATRETIPAANGHQDHPQLFAAATRAAGKLRRPAQTGRHPGLSRLPVINRHTR